MSLPAQTGTASDTTTYLIMGNMVVGWVKTKPPRFPCPKCGGRYSVVALTLCSSCGEVLD